MVIGQNISKFRKNLNISQEELAKKLFVTRQTISQWEKNQTLPTLDNLLRLKEIFGVSVDQIISPQSKPKMTCNSNSLDTICATLAYALGVEPPKNALNANWDLTNYIDKVFDGKKVDRVVMYNPDAIAHWIYKKYPDFFEGVKKYIGIEIPLASVIPPVTPVCFATLYTGAQPSVHGIEKYEKPIITIDSIFDALVRAGKKVALVTYNKCSLGRLFLGRDIDYYHFDGATINEVNAKALELIVKDEHDFIVVYNGNYDTVMHKKGPESPEALAELRVNCHIFAVINELIKSNWKHHNTLVGFAMDHGCHEIDNSNGSHGLNMPEDINITHFYKGYIKGNGK